MINNRVVLFSIIISIIFTIIFFTLSERSTQVNYQFKENITINDLENSKVGEVTIINNKYLPVKLDLKKFKACIFNNNVKFTYNIFYSISDENSKSSYSDFNTGTSMEIPGMKTKNYSMKMYLEYPLIKNNLELELYSGDKTKTIGLYIFEVNQINTEGRFIEFCENVKKENSYYNITITN